MSSGLYQPAKRLFLEALDLPGPEREELLDRLRADNEPLAHEVASLLEQVGDSREAFGVDSRAETVFAPTPGGPVEQIENYVLLQKLGAGGMGEVWEAEQLAPVKRRVAIKLIQRGMNTREVVARFEAERQALALMTHPNIARVFDAGSTSAGRPFFVMELVQGVPIDTYCDREHLDTAARLRIFVAVCRGVQHAHQKGVIHRDLKPSNVLVSDHDGRPVPKIIDFGVARATALRLTERTLFTQLGQWIGTPEYMSPEQAEMGRLDIDTRTDVYSLGVLLYELLVGALPFGAEDLRRAGFDEMRRMIREDQPTRPSAKVSALGTASSTVARNRHTDPTSLARELRGDLDWIALKCLEKERVRRYDSPSALAADIERFLHDEPVSATPPGPLYRPMKFFRRHRLGSIATLMVVLAVLLGIVGTGVGMMRARREAETARLVADEMVSLFGAMDPSGLSGPSTTKGLIDRGAERMESRLADQPLVQARLGAAIGSVYSNLGYLEEARAMLDRALERYRIHDHTDHPDFAQALSFLGWLEYRAGDYEAARAAAEEALGIRLRTLGEKNQAVAQSLVDVGHIAWKDSDFAAAAAFLDRGERLTREVLGDEHWLLAVALHYQGILRIDSREFDEARQLLEEALAISHELFGEEHGQAAWIELDLGRVMQLAGDATSAREYMSHAMATIERMLGPEHPSMAFPLAWLAAIEGRAGNHDAAVDMFERSLRIREEGLGVSHPDVAWTLRPYGAYLLRQGDVDRARAMIERAARINRNALPFDHVQHTYDLAALGALDYTLGRYAEAEARYEQALEMRIRLLGEESRSLDVLLYNLACLSALQGDRKQALERLRRAVDLGFRLPLLLEDPDLDSLRGDAEFEAIADAIRQEIDTP